MPSTGGGSGTVPSEPGSINVMGEIACLPKKGTGLQTMECAMGLKGNDAKYYALKNLFAIDPEYKFSQTGLRVKVFGTLLPPEGNSYDVAGAIDVKTIEEVGSASSGGGTIGEFNGTIFGTVMLGPACPVMRDPPDPECADKPYATNLVLTTADGAREIKKFSSDSSGRFRLEVPPGKYRDTFGRGRQHSAVLRFERADRSRSEWWRRHTRRL
ncbi:MAG: hypothetical protein HYV68_00500 [Candidatus Taylorbacteria bacterium]|nr:hypothetical protein [Candidatus Taylorbacteria bacterium]